MAHLHIVHARPPARPFSRPFSRGGAPDAAMPAVSPPLPSDAALVAFEELAKRWRLPRARAWRLLNGRAVRPRALGPEEVRRVSLLLAVEAVMATVVPDVGAWAADPNPGPLLMGASPVEFLSRLGTPGFLSLLRQARRWAEM